MDQLIARLDSRKHESVQRTRTGIILIFAGLVFSPIPSVRLYAGLSSIAGAILLYLGRHALGKTHQAYVSKSFITLVLTEIFVAIISAAIGGALAAIALTQPTEIENLLTNAYVSSTGLVLAANIIIYLALVYFVYDLQDRTGRTVLWTGFALGCITNLLVLYIVMSELPSIVPQILSQSTSLVAAWSMLGDEFVIWSLLAWIPAIPYAVAYYWAYRHVEKQAVTPEIIQASLISG
jgi:hypothetical protein